jgi:hypothetical protein
MNIEEITRRAMRVVGVTIMTLTVFGLYVMSWMPFI